MPEVIDRPVGTIKIEGVNLDSMHDFMVRVYNNETTDFIVVLGTMMRACGYDKGTAERYVLKIHNEGHAICYWNSQDKCEKVVKEFSVVGVRAEVVDNK